MDNQTFEPITLKEVILTTIAFVKELFRKWWIYVLVVGLAVFIGWYKYNKEKIFYSAQCSVMSSSNSGGGAGSAISALGQQFGLDIGGMTASSGPEGQLLELATSRRIIQETIFKTVELNGKSDLLANHFIRELGWHNNWEENERLNQFVFKHAQVDSFNLLENEVLQNIHRHIVERMMSFDNPGTGLIKLNISSTSEILSYTLNRAITHTLISFYTDGNVAKQRFTYNQAKTKLDSVEKALQNAEYAMAAAQDRNVASVRAKGYLGAMRAQRNVQALTIMYGEALKAAEFSKLSLDYVTPVIQVVDYPLLPLHRTYPSKVVYLGYALFIGLLISTLLIIVWKIIRDALRS